MPRTPTKPPINEVIVLEEFARLQEAHPDDQVQTNELRQRVQRRHGFNEAYLQRSRITLQNTLVRRVLEKATDATDLPVFVNVVVTNPQTGRKQHAYKSRLRLSADEYAQAVHYRVDRANREIRVAVGLADEAYRRRGVQIRLDFDLPGSSGGMATTS
jgi:hypothetical protein